MESAPAIDQQAYREAGRSGAAWRIPAPPTSLIGREAEVAHLVSLLRRDGVRLVTLTGPGGVGKTRLALAAARTLAGEAPAGFVPLSALRDPAEVVAEIGRAIDATEPLDAPAFDRVSAALSGEPALLVLDNLEHLLPAVSGIAALLRACPDLTILATSRARLRLTGEHEIAVAPLAPPDAAGEDRPERVALSPAVRLFVERARAADAHFALADDNAAAVAAICRRLDGLPLAIELAAARARVASANDTLRRLSPRLRLLAGGPDDAPDRLRTMRDTVAWSHDQLPAAARALFARLGAFVGGFTLDAAEAVAGGNDGVATLDALGVLVEQSLAARATDAAGSTRFTMLETVREFALERLVASGEEDAVRRAHADWFIALAERAAPEFRGPDASAWVRRTEADLPNVRAAHAWLASTGDARGALRLAVALGWFWSSSGYFHEGRSLVASVLAIPGAADHPALYADGLALAGAIDEWLGETDAAEGWYRQALDRYRALGDLANVAGLTRGLGSLAIERSDLPRARALLAEARAAAAASGAEWDLATATNLLAAVAFAEGRFADAIAGHAEAAARWRGMGDLGHVPTALAGMALAALAALAAGDPRRAADVLSEVLRDLAPDDDFVLANTLLGAAGVAAAERLPDPAARLAGAVDAARVRLGTPLRPAVERFREHMLATLERRLGRDACIDRLREGREMSGLDAVAFARETVAGIAAAPRPSSPHGLSRRELEVLRLLAHGSSDREIAETLFISRRSASKHVSSILAKLDVSSRTAAAVIAHRDGLA